MKLLNHDGAVVAESPSITRWKTNWVMADGSQVCDAENAMTLDTDSATKWLIDIGPFYDRFGATKIAVLSCTDATVKAIISDLSIRKWIDLKRADVASALAYVHSVVPSLTTEIVTAILTAPVTDVENLALRKLYF